MRSVGRATVVLSRLRGHLVLAFSFLVAGNRGAGTDVFCLVSSDRPHGKSMKLAEIRFDWGRGAVWSQVLDLIILVGPFQLKVFCDRSCGCQQRAPALLLRGSCSGRGM